MSEVHALIVLLEKPISEEHANAIAQAIKMIGGVVDVRPKTTDASYYDGWQAGANEAKGVMADLLRALDPRSGFEKIHERFATERTRRSR